MAQSQLLIRLEEGNHEHQSSTYPAVLNTSHNLGPRTQIEHANQVPGRPSLVGPSAGLLPPTTNNPWATTDNKLNLSEEIARLEARIQRLRNQINNTESQTSRLRASRLRINLPCSICLDIPSELPALCPTARCTHASTICAPCLEQHISHAVLDQGSTSLTCPDPECRQAMEYADVLRGAKNNKTCLDRYEKLLLRRTLETEPNFVWCKDPACGWGQLHESGAAAPIVICQVCHARSCFIHDAPWHTGLTCEQYTAQMRSREQDCRASQAYLEQRTKRCPNTSCRRPIEKAEGCDHMTCRRPAGCGHEFCWICFADYAPIRRDGNHRHKPSCKHYAPVTPSARSQTYGAIERPQGDQRAHLPVTRPENERTPLLTTRPAVQPARLPPGPAIQWARPDPGPPARPTGRPAPAIQPTRPISRPAIRPVHPTPRPIRPARSTPRPAVRTTRPVSRPQYLPAPFNIGRRQDWRHVGLRAIKIAFCLWLFLSLYSLSDWLSG